jgi:hypothetical protein
LSDSSLYELVATQFPEEVTSEADFTDAVQKTLRNARFMLLIVGDGIRENLEDILGLLHQQPQMLFTFGLVEMQIYECDAVAGRLIVPQLVARTSEIVRAVVHVEGRGDVTVSVNLPTEPKGKGTTLSEQEFLESVEDSEARDLFIKLIAVAKEIGCIHCATRSISACMPFHNTGDLHFFRLFDHGTIGMTRLGRQLHVRGLPEDLAWTFAREVAALFPDVNVKPDRPGLSRRLKAGEVAGKLDDFVAVYRRAAAKLKTMTPTTVPTSDENETDEDEEDVSNARD